MVRANQDSEADVLPSRELVQAMSRYNQEMVEAGVLLSAEALHPSSQGARIRFSKGAKLVVDGPFAETRELIAGFWMIQVASRREAIEWALRCPAPFGEGQDGEIELRRIQELEEFPAAILPPEEAERLRALRAKSQSPSVP